MVPRWFWFAVTVGVASSVAAAASLTAGYYESRVIPRAEAHAAQEVVTDAFESVRGPEKTGLVFVEPDIMVLVDPDAGNARPWWIAGGVFAALAIASLGVAVVRRPKARL